MNTTWILLLLPLLASAQQIVVKHTGQMADIVLGIGRAPWTDIDVDGDGVLEVNAGQVSDDTGFWGLLNIITGELYRLAPVPPYINLDSGTTFAGFSKCRDLNHAEFTTFGGEYLKMYDVATGEILFQSYTEPGLQRVIVRDFDGDGLDDVFVFSPYQNGAVPACYDYIVLGTGAANLASPGNTLTIESIGSDSRLTWQSVQGADGYRVLWSADPETPCFTQVGYTTESSFIQIGFADVPKGFYKVIAVSAGGHSGGVAAEGWR